MGPGPLLYERTQARGQDSIAPTGLSHIIGAPTRVGAPLYITFFEKKVTKKLLVTPSGVTSTTRPNGPSRGSGGFAPSISY